MGEPGGNGRNGNDGKPGNDGRAGRAGGENVHLAASLLLLFLQ